MSEDPMVWAVVAMAFIGLAGLVEPRLAFAIMILAALAYAIFDTVWRMTA